MAGNRSVNIEHNVYIDLMVEDKPLPEMNNFVDALSITESISMAAPVLQLQVMDMNALLSHDLSMVEGTKISVTLAKSLENDKKLKADFRLFGSKQTDAGPGALVELIFLYDNSLYTTEACRKAYAKGAEGSTSKEVFEELAGEVSLEFDGPSADPSDKQIWLNIGKTRASFTEDVLMHSFVSAKSCMNRVVTLDGKLRYKDMIDQIKTKPIKSFLHNAPVSAASADPVLVRETRNVSATGMVNTWLNYGHKVYYHSFSGTPTKLEKLDFDKSGGTFLPINSDTVTRVSGTARIEYGSRIDCGSEEGKPGNNVHFNYNQAVYQNLRFLALFSERVHVLVDDQTDLHCLDCVEYIQHDFVDGKYEINPKTSGNYLISAKTLFVKSGQNYVEKFELIRPTVTQNGSTNLL